MRKIVCAAVRFPRGLIVCGVRHFDALMRQHMPRTLADIEGLLEQGFVDDHGVFVDRSEAYDIALRAGQFNTEDFKGIRGNLCSEDLY